jgi:hypothetical protein
MFFSLNENDATNPAIPVCPSEDLTIASVEGSSPDSSQTQHNDFSQVQLGNMMKVVYSLLSGKLCSRMDIKVMN